MSSEVSELGGVWLLSSTLLDARRAQAIKRTTKKIKAFTGMADAVSEVVVELMGALSLAEPSPASASAGAGASADSTSGSTAREVRAKASGGGRRTPGYALGGGGIVALGAGVVFGILAKKEYTKAQGLQGDANAQAALEAAKSAGIRNQALANVGYGVGAVAVGLGIYFGLTGGAASAPEMPRLSVAPSRGGGMLVLEGGF